MEPWTCWQYLLLTAQPVVEAGIPVMDAPKLLTQKSAFPFSYVTIYVTLGTSPQKRP